MIFRDIIESRFGITKLFVLGLVWLGIYYNAAKNIMFLVLLSIWVIAYIDKSDFIGFFSIICIVFVKNIINYGGHDYNKYVDWLNIPIECFFLVSLLSVILLYIGFRKKNRNYNYVLPFLFLMNPSLRYMASGVLRNLIAFSLWNIHELFIVIIPFIHVSSSVYFIVYYLNKILVFDNLNLNPFWKYLGLCGLVVVTIICYGIFPSNFFRVIQYFTKWNYLRNNFWYFGNWKYYVLVSTTILPVYWINYRKLNSWIILYCFMFVYIYHFKFMIRMVYISWFSLTNLIVSLPRSDFNKKYLLSLSLYYLTSVIP